MRLMPSTVAPRVTLHDAAGKPYVIGRTEGQPTILCFFRDLNCPICNYRLTELTHHYDILTGRGVRIVAVFAATVEEIGELMDNHGFPFPVLADPQSAAYKVYGVEESFWRKWKGVVAHLPTALKGLRIVGPAGLNTSNLMPADFLIAADGRIIEAWYGRDAGDRIPFAHIEMFAGTHFGVPPVRIPGQVGV